MAASVSAAVTIVVLGDLGRSPRMQYHALALADSMDVHLVGHTMSDLPSAVTSHPRIQVHALPHPRFPGRHRWPRPLFVGAAAFNQLEQAYMLARRLVHDLPRTPYVLVQTPPALPTLPIVRLAGLLRGSALIIDWHNLGYTLLGLQLGPEHPVVRAVARAEKWWGRRAHGHLCVSDGMRHELETWGIERPRTLYDRPGIGFEAPTDARRAELRHSVASELQIPLGAPWIVSSSSWSRDEDYDLLLDVLRRDSEGPPRVFILTGQGPLRTAFIKKLSEVDVGRSRVVTPWLRWDRYRDVLASADLGLCLHRSSSGVDLPMKVLDMFGSGLPVLALDYGPTLEELIRPGENGFVFSNATALAGLLDKCLDPYPSSVLSDLRANITNDSFESWSDAWQPHYQAIFGD